MGETVEALERTTMPKVVGGFRAQQSHVLGAIALSRFRTLDLYRFLARFTVKEKEKGLKALRREFGKKVSYEERLSDEITEMREDRF